MTSSTPSISIPSTSTLERLGEMTRSEQETFDICGFCGGKVYVDSCLDCGTTSIPSGEVGGSGESKFSSESSGESRFPSETWGYVIERDKAGCSGQAVLQAIIAYLRGPSGVGETFADAELKLRRANARTFLLALSAEHGPKGCRAVNVKTGAPTEYYVLANAQGSITATRL